MPSPSYRQNDREKALRLDAEAAEALAPAGAAWARFLLDCYAADSQGGYDSFWAGPSWFLEELGPPLLNEAGQRFEADLWIAHIAKGWPVEPESVWAQRQAALGDSPTFDLLHPAWPRAKPGAASGPLDGSDQRVLAHVMRLFEQEHRHYRFEIHARCQKLALELLARGVHTPEPRYGVRDLAVPLVPQRNPKLQLWNDNNYWFVKYAPEVVFGSEPQELMSQRWTAMLMSLLAPEFIRNRSLSLPRSTAYVLPSDGDWVWAILADTVDQFNSRWPELALLWRTGKKNNHGVIIWQPPVGDWIERLHASVLLSRAVRGIEVNLMWFVRHFKRLIRFYEPLLIPFFTARGETLLPAAFKE
jgi:hypothetical protein